MYAACKYILFMIPLSLVAVSGYDVVTKKVDLPEALAYGGLDLHIYAPRSTETFPVIWFVSGGGGTSPVSAYSKLFSQIVAHGYIIAGLDHSSQPMSVHYIKYGRAFHDIMEWGRLSLAGSMAIQNLSAVPDAVNRTAVMGQSAGNHVVGQGLTDGCSAAKAFIMIDPVDGFDPYRIIKNQDLIKPGQKVNFSIPALLLDNGLDPVKLKASFPPCAPANISNDHFYNAWVGPIWNINATAYGHVDCTDEPVELVCPSDPKTDKDMYRAMLAEAVTLFLGALFDGQSTSFELLEDSSHWKVDVVLKHDLKGKSHGEIAPGCANVETLPLLL